MNSNKVKLHAACEILCLTARILEQFDCDSPDYDSMLLSLHRARLSARFVQGFVENVNMWATGEKTIQKDGVQLAKALRKLLD